MNEPPEKPAASSMPLSEWLALMLGEIERKETEANAAAEEKERRARDGAANTRTQPT
jgi:hypothetical protein